MQSQELLRDLGALDREMIEHRVRLLIDRRADSDVEGMLDYAAPDIVCRSMGSWRFALFPRPVVGKAAVAETYRMLNIKYENLGSTVHEFLIDGDRVALHRSTTVRNRGTSEVFTFDVVNFVRFRDGLIVEFSEYPDAGAAAAVEDLRD